MPRLKIFALLMFVLKLGKTIGPNNLNVKMRWHKILLSTVEKLAGKGRKSVIFLFT